MIDFDQVDVTYPDAAAPVLRDVDLQIDEGELCLVVGRTGAGKSTLARRVNGLVPHFTGGTLAGRVTVDGRDTAESPAARARRRGRRGRAGPAGRLRHRHRRGGARLRDGAARRPAGGDAQAGRGDPRPARARRPARTGRCTSCPAASSSGSRSARCSPRTRGCSCSTSRPRRSTRPPPRRCSPRSPGSCTTSASPCVLAEHRLERVVQYADRVIHLPGDGTVPTGRRRDVRARTAVAPPVVELGRLAGWDPLPLSVRDARRAARPRCGASLASEATGRRPDRAVGRRRRIALRRPRRRRPLRRRRRRPRVSTSTSRPARSPR